MNNKNLIPIILGVVLMIGLIASTTSANSDLKNVKAIKADVAESVKANAVKPVDLKNPSAAQSVIEEAKELIPKTYEEAKTKVQLAIETPNKFIFWTQNGKNVVWGEYGNGYFFGDDNNGKHMWGTFYKGWAVGFYDDHYFIGKYWYKNNNTNIWKWQAWSLFENGQVSNGRLILFAK